MKRITGPVLFLSALALLAAPALADPLAISNHSFETPDLTAGGNTWSNVNQDWGDAAGDSGDEFTEFIPGFAAEGEQHTGVQASSSIMQDLTATYDPITIYTLTVGVGNRQDFTFAGNETILQLADASTGSVLAESIVDASMIPVGTFEDRSLVYTTGASGDPLGNNIRIMLGVGDEAGGRAHFDNVRLDATVIPEPSTLALAVFAGLGLALAARRKRRG